LKSENINNGEYLAQITRELFGKLDEN